MLSVAGRSGSLYFAQTTIIGMVASACRSAETSNGASQWTPPMPPVARPGCQHVCTPALSLPRLCLRLLHLHRRIITDQPSVHCHVGRSSSVSLSPTWRFPSGMRSWRLCSVRAQPVPYRGALQILQPRQPMCKDRGFGDNRFSRSISILISCNVLSKQYPCAFLVRS
jgi:hypothetical protein